MGRCVWGGGLPVVVTVEVGLGVACIDAALALVHELLIHDRGRIQRRARLRQHYEALIQPVLQRLPGSTNSVVSVYALQATSLENQAAPLLGLILKPRFVYLKRGPVCFSDLMHVNSKLVSSIKPCFASPLLFFKSTKLNHCWSDVQELVSLSLIARPLESSRPACMQQPLPIW